jgi:hypothetical protein
MTINTTAIETPEDALKAQTRAHWKRAWAAQTEGQDPLGARWERLEADELDAKAAHVLDPSNVLTAPLAVGRGGELIIETTEAQNPNKELLLDTVKDSLDMVAANASLHRLELAGGADVLAMTVDVADTIRAETSLERMLAGQLAALHMLAMKNAATASSFVNKAADICAPTQQRQIANVEAARSANAAARATEAFQRGLLTLDKLRNGGRQTVVVQHVNVANGGKAVVAGAMQAGGYNGL